MKVVAALMLFLAACSSAPSAGSSLRVGFSRDWQTWSEAQVEPGGSITGRIFLGYWDDEGYVGLYCEAPDRAWRVRDSVVGPQLLAQFNELYGDDEQRTLSWDGVALCLR